MCMLVHMYVYMHQYLLNCIIINSPMVILKVVARQCESQDGERSIE